jgi:hypothetical protein
MFSDKKVKCIVKDFPVLIENKIYEVYYESEDGYTVKNETGSIVSYRKNMFEEV